MPRKSAIKCYFGCATEGPFHRFPQPVFPNLEKFEQWKMILSDDVKRKGNYFIYDNIRICDCHFQEHYRSASKRLTRNAVPTLNLCLTSPAKEHSSSAVETEMDIDMQKGDNSASCSQLMDIQHIHKVPTLNLCLTSPAKEHSSSAVETEMDIDMQKGDNSASCSQLMDIQHIHKVPTLNLCLTSPAKEHTSSAVETEMDIDMQKGDNSASCSQLMDIQHTNKAPQNKLLSSASSKQKQLPKVNTRTQKCSKEFRTLKARILKLRSKCKTLSERVRQARKLTQSQAFLKAVQNLPEPAAIFINMQLKKSCKMPRGRRFSMKEKILCLTMYKQSQKAYNFLQRTFTLPSKRTMQKILSSISLTAGINETIFKHLTKVVKKLPEEKRLCTLIFDEVALTPGLYFQKNVDEIVGFEDFGEHRTSKIADHALVFMLKSLKGKYKQPICFTFCQSATKSEDLKKLIKDVIEQVNSTGLKIVSTIYDQSPTNMKVLKSLHKDTTEKYLRNGAEWKSLAFEINNNKIFPIFDPPHLLKGLRNNLMIKNLKFTQNGEEKVAQWNHLQMLLDIDVGEHDIRLVNKLTEMHVNKDKVPKMKVKHAAQVFSQRVSAALRFLANHNLLPKECLATADLLLLVDKLFDSFNGHSYQDSAKTYKSALKKNSPHFKLWDEALPILNSMGYEIQKNGASKFVKVPSIKNWIHNIHVMKEMFTYLTINHSISSLLTRNLNQDPLENFFSSIRSNGIRNVSPTCCQFVGSYKTLIVNNLTSPHSIGANCELDNNKILKPLICLINSKAHKAGEKPDANINVDSLINLFEQNFNAVPSNFISKEAKRYVAGYLVHKCIKKISSNCNVCKMQLLSTMPPTQKDYILERDYTNKSCKYPSEALCSFLDEVCIIIQSQLNEEPQKKNIKDLISQKIKIFCNFSFLSCENHNKKLLDFLINTAINVIVHSWCTNVNRLLKGKMSGTNEDDNVKVQATKYYNMHKKRKINN